MNDNNNLPPDDGAAQPAAPSPTPSLGERVTAEAAAFNASYGFTGEAEAPVERLQFSGDGWEYFRIWIVNLALSILTLGIYSAWAKVRTLRYFYSRTHFANSSFDFHGRPIPILIGRIIAVTLFLLTLLPYVGPVFMVVLVLLMPWLLSRAMRFRLSNTSYRNLRFAFRGSAGGAYRALFLPYLPILVLMGLGGLLAFGLDSPGFGFTLFFIGVVAAYLIFPYLQCRWRRYFTNNAYAGAQPFSFHATGGNYYLVYLIAFGIFIVLSIVFSTLGAFLFFDAFEQLSILSSPDHDPDDLDFDLTPSTLLGIFMMVIMYGLFIAVGGAVVAMLHNVVWTKTALAGAMTHSNLSVPRYTLTWFGCLLLTILTLGFYRPFALVRLARMRVEATGWTGTPEQLVAVLSTPTQRAIGEEVAEVFDFDIGG